MDNNTRLVQHRKPAQLESLLRRLEKLFGPLEAREINEIEPCDEPILYIMGCARSGTTLVFQYLAQTGVFTYPTNFLSRFYYAPYLGALLQAMLIDADFANEIFQEPTEETFASHLGKTRGPKSPHEFWYFWRRFFKFGDVQQLTPEELEKVDVRMFLRELQAFQAVEKRPLLLKGLILNWHIPFLSKIHPRSYFLFVRRSLTANASSLIRARQEFYGDDKKWYSFKPPGYDRVLKFGADYQTAWQVVETNQAIERGLAALPPERVFQMDYEDFCGAPHEIVKEICRRWRKTMPDTVSTLPEKFEVRPDAEARSVDWAAVLSQIKQLSHLPITS